VLELKSAARGVRYAAASPLDETWKRREARIGGSLRVTGPGETGEGSQRKEMGEAGLFFFLLGERLGCWWRAHGIAGVALPHINK
jgi:hypothetical protein